MKTHTPMIGLLGGTFDPVHQGHIEMAQHCLQTYPLDEIQCIPNRLPADKKHPHASVDQRKHMIQLAINDASNISINTIELEKNEPSYTVETLKTLRTRYPNNALCFILGCDVFDRLDQWHEWQQLTTLCHLIVIGRSHAILSLAPWQQQLLTTHQTDDPNKLAKSSAGCIILDPFTPQNFCSTTIRQQLRTTNPVKGLQQSVSQYIKQHDLYR
jgi:nicotinate-nucleotide adenylyltransferase